MIVCEYIVIVANSTIASRAANSLEYEKLDGATEMIESI